MKQWKQKIACLLAGIMVITGFFPWNSPISIHAEESVIKSSVDDFEYRLRTSGTMIIFVLLIQDKFTIIIKRQSKRLLIYQRRLY